MSTYREQVYLILDELKGISDDFSYTEDHIIYLLDKYRAYILKKTYSDIKKQIPESNYQTLCLDLEDFQFVEGACQESYLRSTSKLPNLMGVGNTKIYPIDYFNSSITYVSNKRFKVVGHNKYLQNIIYATIGPDNYIYLNSSNPQFKYLESIKITGIFENAKEAAKLGCDNNENNICDVLDMNYPLEEGLIPAVNELILKELTAAIYKPADTVNNAKDDLADIMSFVRRNMKSQFQKQVEE